MCILIHKPKKLPYPSLFGSLATKSEKRLDHYAKLPYPSLFGSLATGWKQMKVMSMMRCHTLLFSGRLQPTQVARRTERKNRLPYPSLFGSLATVYMFYILILVRVAIPFSFRVACNENLTEDQSPFDELPYPSLFGSVGKSVV